MPTRPARLILSLAALVLVAGCGSDSPTTTAATTSTTSGSSAPDPTTTTTAAPAGNVIEITVDGGSVVGGVQRAKAKLGEEVTLRVTADVADEVHVHGYDKKIDVAPGYPAELTFTADIPGVFEIELEAKGLKIAELEVS